MRMEGRKEEKRKRKRDKDRRKEKKRKLRWLTQRECQGVLQPELRQEGEL